MNIVKKLLVIIFLFDQVTFFAIDNRKDLERKNKKNVNESMTQDDHTKTIWAGIAGAAVGVVAGVAFSSWLTGLDNIECIEDSSYAADLHEYKHQSLKELKIKQQLDQLRRYGKVFDLQENEQAVIGTLNKLGIHLYQIDENFYTSLERDYQTLSDIGYSVWWHSFKNLESQKNLYLVNSQNIILFLRRHYSFIQACQIINSYDQYLNCQSDITSLMYVQPYRDRQYPLIDYKNKIESDLKILSHVRYSKLYPALAQKTQIICKFLDSLLQSMYACHEYQHQVMQKKQDELIAEINRIEQEKLDIAYKNIRLQEEANRIMAEKNRIEADKFFRDKK